MANIKKSNYIKKLSNQIMNMFDSCGDNSLIGEMFSKDSNLGNFKKEDFVDFLNSSYFKSIGIFRLFDKKGEVLDFELFKEEASLELLRYFEENKFEKNKKFSECFFYNKENGKNYFDEMALIIVNVLEKYGKPPLFHKTRDKVLRYDWEAEKLSAVEVKSIFDKKMKNFFDLSKEDNRDCLSLMEDNFENIEEVEEKVRKILKKIDGWHIYVPNDKTFKIIDN